jgi:hypothetical protein
MTCCEGYAADLQQQSCLKLQPCQASFNCVISCASWPFTCAGCKPSSSRACHAWRRGTCYLGAQIQQASSHDAEWRQLSGAASSGTAWALEVVRLLPPVLLLLLPCCSCQCMSPEAMPPKHARDNLRQPADATAAQQRMRPLVHSYSGSQACCCLPGFCLQYSQLGASSVLPWGQGSVIQL